MERVAADFVSEQSPLMLGLIDRQETDLYLARPFLSGILDVDSGLYLDHLTATENSFIRYRYLTLVLERVILHASVSAPGLSDRYGTSVMKPIDGKRRERMFGR